MRRWAWRILVAGSGVLLIGTLWLWARSQSSSDYLWCRFWRGDSHRSPTGALWVITHRQGPVWHYRSADFQGDGEAGAANFGRDMAAAPRWVSLRFDARNYEPGGPDDYDEFHTWNRWDFVWQAGVRTRPRSNQWGEAINGNSHWYGYVTHCTLAVPWWFLAACFALAPTRALWTWCKVRRRPAHACPGCGYDLRATAAAGGPLLETCPECGRPSADAPLHPRKA